MEFFPEILAQAELVENHLTELDPILQTFCIQSGYTFGRIARVWPRRRAFRRDELDRCFDLTMDLTVAEFAEQGFFPEMPWSLYVTAATRPSKLTPAHILTHAVFERLPLSSLHSRLAEDLSMGLAILQAFTPEVVKESGCLHVI